MAPYEGTQLSSGRCQVTLGRDSMNPECSVVLVHSPLDRVGAVPP